MRAGVGCYRPGEQPSFKPHFSRVVMLLRRKKWKRETDGETLQTLSRPRLVLITICARTRLAICFEIICCESANGSVNRCTEAGPWESRSIIARRVGSDKAANVVPRLSTTLWLYIVGSMSSVNFAILDFCSLISEP